VIRYDLRGFGRSSRPAEPFTRLGDLRELLDHFGIEEVLAGGPLLAAQDRDSLVRLGLRTWAPAGADDAVAALMRRAVSS
jgi:hypothetical protein